MQDIPKTQTAAVVTKLGGKLEFRHDWPVPQAGKNEVLAKILYTGVCQSDLHTKSGTAASPTGAPITNIKLPHVGGHEGVGRIISLGSDCSVDIKLGTLVGIRFASRICRRCSYCLAGQEQHCTASVPLCTNHLHHEDGSFQEYIALDADYLTILPDDVDPITVGPTLCAGLTAYKAVKNASLLPGQIVVVSGAGGGLGHFAVQYARCFGATVIAIDTGVTKADYLLANGAAHFVDFATTPDVVSAVKALTPESLGAHAVVVTAASARAFEQAGEMLRPGGALCLCGIPAGEAYLKTPVAGIVIKGLRIFGNLTGSLKECMDAVELVRVGKVVPRVEVRAFEELENVYVRMEKGDILGRVVLRIAKDEV